MVRESEIYSALMEFIKQSDMLMVAMKMLGFLFANMFLLFIFFNLLHLSPWYPDIRTVSLFNALLPIMIVYTGHLAFPVFWRVGQVLQI